MIVNKKLIIIFSGFAMLFLIAMAANLLFKNNRSKFVSDTDTAPTCKITCEKMWVYNEEDTTDKYSFFKTSAIKVHDNCIYIVDSGNNRIMKYNKLGIFLQKIGRAGQGPGELLAPSDIDFDLDGFIYVTNKANNRVEIFSPDGKYYYSFNLKLPIQSFLRASIAIGSHREIYLNIPTSGKLISVYSNEGKMLRKFGHITKYNTPLEVSLFNSGSMEFDHTTESLYFMYVAKPLFKKFNQNGELLISHSYIGKDIRKAYEAWERNKKNAKAGSIGWMIFFYDMALLPSKHLFVSTEIGHNLYLINTNGDVSKKYQPILKKNETLGMGRLSVMDEKTLFIADIYDNKVFKLVR